MESERAPKTAATFKPHSEGTCSVCDTRPMWCSIQLVEDEEGGVELESIASSVPSLGFVAAGLPNFAGFREDQAVPARASLDLWRHLKVKTAMEIVATMSDWRAQHRFEAFQLFRHALTSGVLVSTSKLAFNAKVRSISNLVERLQTDARKEYPDCQSQISDKIRKMVSFNFYDCDPKCPSKQSKLPSGVVVQNREDGRTRFFCCLCPANDCQGECSVSFKAVPRIKATKKLKSSSHPTSSEAAPTPDSKAMQWSPQSSESEDGYQEGDDFEDQEQPQVEQNSTYSYTEDKISFKFVVSDSDATHNFLSSQNDASGWAASKVSEEEIILTRSGSSLKVNVSFKPAPNGFVHCSMSGEGLEPFSDEIVPSLVKLTSSKLVEDGSDCYDDQNGISPGDRDEDPFLDSEVEPTEMVFVEESLSSTSSHQMSWRKPRSKSQLEFQCRGCGANFKYKSSFLKHEAKCGKASIPDDVRDFPLLADGRKPCPGCGKAFASVNLFYLRHLRACPKIKKDGFPCKACGDTFSSYKTWAHHRSSCKVGNNTSEQQQGSSAADDDWAGPSPIKQLKIENVVSLQPQIKQTKTWVNQVENHKIVCKVGDYTCPLCFVKFRLNQPYGKHLKKQDCTKRKADVKAPAKNKLALLHITIHPGIKGDDSVVGFNRVSQT